MSIFFDFDVGPKGRRFRRAVDSDRHDIQVFWKTALTEPLFGEVNIGSLIELTTLAICMIDEKNAVTGFMALSDHPPLPCVDPADWEIWIRNAYERFYLSRNTLFVHFVCCIDEVHQFFVDEAFTSVFNNDPYLSYIVLFVPSGCLEDCYLRFPILRKCSVFRSKTCIEGESLLMITAFRQDFSPKLKTRRAVEEDNEDVVEILDKICPRLKELYGEYYISEIIGRHPDSCRKIIVAEHEDRAVGVMCLNTNINYEKIQKMYELNPFYGLKKSTPLEREKLKRSNNLLATFGNPIMNGKWSPFSRMEKLENIGYKYNVSNKRTQQADLSERPLPANLELLIEERATNVLLDSTKMDKFDRISKSSRVNFGLEAIGRSMEEASHRRQRSEDIDEAYSHYSPTQSQVTNFSVSDLLEEDPFDYEIVNIDTKLLTLPEVLSVEKLPNKNTKTWRRRRLSVKHIRRRNRQHSVTSPLEEQSKKTIYSGGNNAFMIELFGLRDNIDERHAFDMLEAAFEVMKDYDYCIIQLPFAESAYSLLQHFCYVPTKNYYCSEYALYVAHRSSVMGKLRVREAEFSDIPQIAHLMQNVDGKETIWTIENTILRDKEHSVFVFLCGTKIVGVGVLESPEQINFIRSKFNIETYHIHKYHTDGLTCGFTTLKTMLAYPIFEPHYRFFARDMMRLSGSNIMLWMTAYRNKWVAHKANSMIAAMVPLLPRRFEIDCAYIPESKRINKLSKNMLAFATWCISKKFSSLPKINITSRIVIVGASTAAMALLETLLFGDASTNLTFMNVTLISSNGLPYVRHAKSHSETMFLKHRTTSGKYLKSIPYTYYVNVVRGTVVEIDRTKKLVKLASESIIHYDLLCLMMGKQYQQPDYLNDILEEQTQIKEGNVIYQTLDMPRSFEGIQTRTEYLPDNVFVINDTVDANKAITYVRNLIWHNGHYKIIVYGAYIHAYCCLATLLEMNVNPENIYFVEPFPPEDTKKTRVPVFCNVYVDQTLKEVFDSLKVNVYRSHYFKSWTIGPDNRVNQVQFLSYFKLVQLECSAFFYYGKRGINTQAFVAIHKSGIGYDGGVLIDHQFRTKDPNVYAAGPCTRYYRRYYAENKRQKYYDSHEAGVKLGTLIRNNLDPLFEPKEKVRKKLSDKSSEPKSYFETIISETSYTTTSSKETNESDNTQSKKLLEEVEKNPPDLKKPIVIYCKLPGTLQYLEVRPPGVKKPHYYVQSLSYNGFVWETYKVGYFKLHLTPDYIVDGITCLSPEKEPIENFANLYGLSAVVLNNLQIRFAANKVDNFYDYFRQPWAYFLYIDKVEELFGIVKELLPKGENQGKTLGEALSTIGKRLSNPSYRFNTKMKIRSNFEKSFHIEAIFDYVLDWLTENDIHLPMYLHPDHTAQYMPDLENHPAFRKKKRILASMFARMDV